MTEILQGVITVFLFFFVLGTLVLVHELGHFITARLAGVRVLEFGIGFPPRAKILRAKGETTRYAETMYVLDLALDEDLRTSGNPDPAARATVDSSTEVRRCR